MLCSQAYRILAVDDSVDNLFLLQTVLEAEGYQVDLADNGLTALAKIQTSPPDLVLLDFMMPEMNGYEVTQMIRQNKQLQTLPILLVTAYGEDQVSTNLTAQIDRFIRKPIDPDDLLNHVQQFLNLDSSPAPAIR